MEQQAQAEGHTLSVENCKKVTATAIAGVDGFSPAQLVLSYAGGRIVVSGSDMKITAFSKQSGQFAAVGNIVGVKYIGKGGSIRQRLFR